MRAEYCDKGSDANADAERDLWRRTAITMENHFETALGNSYLAVMCNLRLSDYQLRNYTLRRDRAMAGCLIDVSMVFIFAEFSILFAWAKLGRNVYMSPDL